MSRWSEFYRPRLGPEYLAYVKRRYAPFIGIVADHIRGDDVVVEAGCGMGTITRALMDYEAKAGEFCGVELDADMITLARFQVGPSADLMWKDIRDPHYGADVIHGHGVLENFDDETIRLVVDRHRRSGARAAIHYVPGEKYLTPSFGDERLMSISAWREIAAPDEVVEFNDGFDYALIWRFR